MHKQMHQTGSVVESKKGCDKNHHHFHVLKPSISSDHRECKVHSDDSTEVDFKLKISVFLTILFVIIGVVVGYFANSLALISDAAHNFTDALALVLALFSVWLQKRPANEHKTFGYHRAGILVAFINSSSLILLSFGIFYEGIERLLHPIDVKAGLMFWAAISGLIVNLVIGLMLHKESKNDITIRSAYIHMLGDAAGTVGIIIGSIIIRYTNFYIIDPVISLIIGLMIIWTAWDILKETVNLLMEGTPSGIRINDITREIKTVEGVKTVHHIHVWAISSQVTALSCHIEVEDRPVSQCNKVLQNVNKLLWERFSISHTTIQLEPESHTDH
ncbi:MAG: cation transporter [Blastocatellia bacterium]|nr:cation transporter [Blastocatellia bacterium]